MSFDGPCVKREEDRLDRWPFAQQIARLAMETPRDWSVRIGVYGGWGTGKTTVLNYVRTIAQEANHVVAWFNPWGCNGAVDLWVSFLESLSQPLRSHPNDRLRSLGAEFAKARTMKKVVRYIGDNQQLIAAVGAGAATVLGIPILGAIAPVAGRTALQPLSTRARRREDSLVGVLSSLGSTRVLVLVDDLDRVNPELLPQLLFALKEILDQPGFSFVLAVDPGRVGEVLRQVNPGWADGKAYLDKIIDFPRELPVPPPRCFKALALSEMQCRCPFVDREALVEVLDLVPGNPRSVRQFVRHIWSLKPLAERHDAGELNWRVVLLTQLIQLSWPGLGARLFTEKPSLLDLLQKFTQLAGLEEVLSEGQGREVTRLETVAAATVASEVDKPRATEAARRLGEQARLTDPEAVTAWCFLVSDPPAATAREWRRFWTAVENAGDRLKAANDWLGAHARTAESANNTMIAALYDRALESYAREVELSIDAIDAELLHQHAARALNALRSLRFLSIDLGGFSGAPPALAPPQLVALVEQAEGRRRFTNHESWLDHRREEHRLLCDIAQRNDLDPATTLAALLSRPWCRADQGGDDFAGAFDDLDRALSSRLADEMLAEFAKGEMRLWPIEGEEARVKRRVFLWRDGPFWETERRAKFLEITRSAMKEKAPWLSMLDLFRLVGACLGMTQAGDERRAVTALLQDQELIDAIWGAVAAREPNPRVVGSLREIAVRLIEGIIGRELPKPEWWATSAHSGETPVEPGSQEQPDSDG